MDKKGLTVIAGLIVVIALAAGGYWYAKQHNTSSPSTSSSSSTQTQASTVNSAVLKTKTSATLGQYLTDPMGKALYTYEKDESGSGSMCTGTCLENWPAYSASSTTNLPANVATITRTDNGQKQFTYKGKPLYYYAQDRSAGQVTGNDVADFYVAKP